MGLFTHVVYKIKFLAQQVDVLEPSCFLWKFRGGSVCFSFIYLFSKPVFGVLDSSRLEKAPTQHVEN